MSVGKEFLNLDDPAQGIQRELGPGVTTRIFVGDQAILSVVQIEPNTEVGCTATSKSSGRAARR